MLDTILVSLSGMNGYSRGLRTISNNVSNMNTPGFKKTELLFNALYSNNLPHRDNQQGNYPSPLGYGVTTYGSRTDFTAGDTLQTGNSLDLAVSGNGFFMLRTPDGETRYTRAGQFDFDETGTLINRSDNYAVLGVGEDGEEVSPISLSGLITSAAKATSEIRFSGILSSTSTEHELSAVQIHDSTGTEHILSVQFANAGSAAPGTWTVTVLDGTKTLGEGKLVFVDGRPDPARAKINFSYPLEGLPAQSITLDFSENVTSFASGTESTLAVSGQNGNPAGSATDVTFDESGRLAISYSNGLSARGGRISLARFDSNDALSAISGNQFIAASESGRTVGFAKEDGFGTLRTGQIENSNVDLSQEFSELVIMQRGYQAASQTVSTANDMIQSLFDMKGRG